MKRVLPVLCLSFLIGSTNPAQEKTTATLQNAAAANEERDASPIGSNESAAKLPVRRVVLYKNGVGYFEHLGRVRGSQDVHIDFTNAQLNDVLKSLTVLDLAGGRITGVDYNSEAPLARRRATLRLALGERPSVSEFLGALRAAKLEVRGATGPALSGRLLSVERKTRSATNWTVETDEISLITDTGEVRSVDLNPTTSVRIVEKDLQVEVGRYLNLIASSRDQDVRRMTISTTGNGERNLYVSYISEVPIWKTTYRIVLPTKADKKPLLQGWAIVDNTVGEDWNEVELSLVAGAPYSFIQQLSEPFYGRRPVVPLPESVQLSPQTHAATLSGGNGRLSGAVTSGSGRPLRGIWLKNTSALTFDGGSSSVLENEVFAGEGLTDPIKPGEGRLLSYATDFLLRHKKGRSLAFIAIPITAAGAFLTASRGSFLWGIINATVTSAAFMWGAPWRQGETVRVFRSIQRVAIGIVLGMVLLFYAYPDALLSRPAVYQETILPDSPTSELTHRGWTYPVGNFLGAFNYERWPYGYGIGTTALGGQYVARFFNVKPPVIGVESGYGTLIVEMGIMGLILWLVMSVAILFSAWSVVKKLKGSPWFPLGFVIFWYAFFLLFPATFGGIQSYEDFLLNASLWLLLGLLFRLPTIALSAQFAANAPAAQPVRRWVR